MAEVVEAAEDGRSIEVFGCGTALLVSSVRRIGYKGKGINYESSDAKEAAQLTIQICRLMKIQYGDVEHKWKLVIHSIPYKQQ